MKRLCLALGLLALTAAAQQAPSPTSPTGNAPTANAKLEPRTFISATEIAERIRAADAAAKAGTPVIGAPLLLSPPVRANMEYHDAPATSVSVHETEAELFVALEGSGTITVGGTLVNPTRNGTNLQAATREGGVPHRMLKGDMLLVPENTAHSVTQVDGRLVLMSLHLPLPAPMPARMAAATPPMR
jgi:mannose-6-phosphate isomerase-like protein (cupin superfamily)